MKAFYRMFALILTLGMAALLVLGCRPASAGVGLAGGGQVLALRSADTEALPRTISVNGSGTATARPDIAYVTLGVQAIDADADKAVTENSERMSAVMGVLKEMKIEDKDIQTVNYSMWLEEERDKEGNLTGVTRYHVVNQVRVKVRDLAKVGQLLQQALKAGANSVEGISFSVDDPSALRKEARDKAIADAKAKAEQLAAGFGAKVGKVHQVSEYSAEPEVRMALKAEGVGGGGEVPISGGELSVSVQIQAIFDLAD